jgi:hypothetical protein
MVRGQDYNIYIGVEGSWNLLKIVHIIKNLIMLVFEPQA